jgi:hypothetical protein
MNMPGREIFRIAALLCATHLLSASLLAQAATNPPAPTPSNSTAPRLLLTTIPPPPGLTPPLLAARSPISFFRELLAMNPAERIQALTNRTPELRTQILAKVREYESLQPDERELRLRVTELRWYLWPLMNTPATNRADLLAMIPEGYRESVEDRLREWDKVPPDVQKELLGIEPTLRYFAEMKGRSDLQRTQILISSSQPRRLLLEQGIQQWDSLSDNQRRNTLRRFDQFFELTAAEKEKALGTLSEPERRQIEKTLQTFGNLRPEQRAQCISSFAKFASLSLEERQQFLKNAERWKLMPPSERQAWRQLVSRLPPPLPPRLPPPLPPMPQSRPPRAVVTNGN